VATSNRQNIAWNAIGGSASIFGSLVLFPLGLLAMGANSYGLWIVCFTTTTLLAQADFGIGTTVIREISQSQVSGRRVGSRSVERVSLAMFGILACTLSVVQYFALRIYLDVTHASQSAVLTEQFLVISSLGLFLSLIGRYFVAVLQAHQRFDVERKAVVGGVLARALVVGLALVYNGPAWVVAVGEMLGIAIPVVFSIAVALRLKYTRIQLVSINDFRRHGVRLVRFSGPVFISAFSSLAAIQAPVYIVAAALSPTAVTAYSAATRIYQTARTVYGWVTGPALPSVARLSAADGSQKIQQIHARLLLQCVALGSTISAVLFSAPELVFEVWLGKDFVSSAAILQVFGLAVLIFASYSPGIVLASALGRPGIIAWGTVVWLLLTLLGSYPAALVGGLQGAALAAVAPALVLFPFFIAAPLRLTGLNLGVIAVPAMLLATLPSIFTLGARFLLAGRLAPTLELAAYGLVALFTSVLLLLAKRTLDIKRRHQAMIEEDK
jgi:O-antigen/teichoic acid export membrane protein